MDLFDQAQVTDAQFRAMSIDAVKRRAAQQRIYPELISLNCAWCGEEIPEARREAEPGCDLCITCQNEKEHLKERR